MTERIPPTPPDGTTSFPDVDDPVALAAWADGIEQSSARAIARQRFVLDMATAQHEITMLHTRPLPAWESPTARRRAWQLVYVGLFLSTAFTLALDLLDGTSPTHVAVVTLIPIACLVWFFLCAFEVVKRHRFRTLARADRTAQVAVIEARRDAAKAHLEDLDAT